MHKTKNLDDDYLGSCKVLELAIKKYGSKNFEKETLYTFNTREEMIEMETVLVNEDFISREDTYNLKLGGFGGFDYATELLFKKYPNGVWQGKKHTEETKTKIGAANSIHQKGSGNSQYGKVWIYSELEKISKRINKNDPIPDGWLKGRKIKFL